MIAAPFELVIGIETHVELATRSKMFCGCAARWFGAPPNTLVCPVCLGLPGALPVPNRRAIDLAITAGLALHCRTPEHTKFDRKNYLYPDLPKGYQISQFDLPLSIDGWLDIPAGGGAGAGAGASPGGGLAARSVKRVGIRRAHLEEDTGRSFHADGATLIDFNRSGVPLLEIVSEPDMSSVAEALAYLEALREHVVTAGVSEFRLEEGAGRFDVNVSIRFTEAGQVRWPPQSEIKNLNSYRALEDAVAYESERLWQDWRSGGELRTRTGKITVGWSPERGRTFLQRQKEEVDDYRYFPEPDLVSLSPARETVERLRAGLPEMPSDRRARFVSRYGLSDYDARVLVADREVADFFEEAVGSDAATASPPGSGPPGGFAKSVSNWVTGEVLRRLKESGVAIEDVRIRPAQLGALVALVTSGEISGTAAKAVFAEVWETGRDPADIVRERGLAQLSDEATIAAAVDEVIAANAKAVADFRAGKARALDALFGQVMKRTGGKANPAVVKRVIGERLASY